MRRIYISLVSLLFCLTAFSQSKSGVAVYKVASITEKQDKKDAYAQLKERAEGAFGFITYKLYFTSEASFFTLDERMNSDANDRQQELALIMAGRGKYYTPLKSDSLLHQTNSQGDLFLVAHSKTNLAWNITAEKKTINGYECLRADGIYKNYGNHAGMKLTAWFSPKLPYMYGPKEYSGLPGLILELDDIATGVSYYCTEIIFDKTVKIEIPDKGIRMNEKEYEAYSKKKSMEFFQLIGN
jgi:GLPGLI family protein